ncbi:MAG: Coenzyme F420 hydrogenase/dehydrogenase, beta subunit C-terminal domain [Anaerolineae bacterium]|nr:Coenzyme F420 hydrogenase/dehydrogenase, beta subunit C-terminal domain [Anaerolineae bacterium]
MLGQYISLWEAQSLRPELRARNGGGIITTLLCYGLEQGLIDQALAVRAASQPPWAEAVIVKTSKEALETAGSKYVFIPYRRLVDKLTPSSALVGLPCQIRAYRKRPFLKLGLFCGLNLSPRGMDYLLKQLRVSPEEISALDYRAPGGGLWIKLRNGREIRYPSYAWLAYFFSYPKCLRCTDYLNHQADIAVGDRRPEWSSVIIRTERGRALFEGAIEAGLVRAVPLSEQLFTSSLMSPFYQKEFRGGYQSLPFVRVRGKWIEHLPLRLLRRIGLLIFRYTKRETAP